MKSSSGLARRASRAVQRSKGLSITCSLLDRLAHHRGQALSQLRQGPLQEWVHVRDTPITASLDGKTPVITLAGLCTGIPLSDPEAPAPRHTVARLVCPALAVNAAVQGHGKREAEFLPAITALEDKRELAVPVMRHRQVIKAEPVRTVLAGRSGLAILADDWPELALGAILHDDDKRSAAIDQGFRDAESIFAPIPRIALVPFLALLAGLCRRQRCNRTLDLGQQPRRDLFHIGVLAGGASGTGRASIPFLRGRATCQFSPQACHLGQQVRHLFAQSLRLSDHMVSNNGGYLAGKCLHLRMLHSASSRCR